MLDTLLVTAVSTAASAVATVFMAVVIIPKMIQNSREKSPWFSFSAPEHATPETFRIFIALHPGKSAATIKAISVKNFDIADAYTLSSDERRLAWPSLRDAVWLEQLVVNLRVPSQREAFSLQPRIVSESSFPNWASIGFEQHFAEAPGLIFLGLLIRPRRDARDTSKISISMSLSWFDRCLLMRQRLVSTMFTPQKINMAKPRIDTHQDVSMMN